MSNNLLTKHDAFVAAISKFRMALSNIDSAADELIQVVSKIGVIDDRVAALLSTSLLPNRSAAVSGAIEGHSGAVHGSQPAADSVEATLKEEPTDERRKKKKRQPVDPNFPKRPLPSVLAFLNNEKKKIRDDRTQKGEPPLTASELNELARERMQALPKEQQETMQREHERKIKAFNREVAEYKAKQNGLPPPSAEPVEEEVEIEEEEVPEEPEQAAEKPEAKKEKKVKRRKDKDGKEISPKKKSRKSLSSE